MLLLGVVLGCPSSPASPWWGATDVRPEPPHTGRDPSETSSTARTGDTGHSGRAAPTLSAACDPTDNALRFLCRVTVDPPQAVRVRVTRDDGLGTERTTSGPEVQALHELVLVFLPEETAHTWIAETVEEGGPEASGAFTTGRVPDVARSALVVSGAPSAPYVGTHQPCNASSTASIYDTTTGALVWYHTLDAGRLGFLDMVAFTEDHTVLGETGVGIVEVDLAGRTLLNLAKGVDYTEEFHHDLVKRGGFVYAIYQDPATGGPYGPMLDAFAVFDATTGLRVADWRAREHLVVPADASGDWMHTNTVSVQENGDVLLSSYEQDTLLSIAGDWTAPDFGEVRWAMAGRAGTGLGDDFALDWGPVAGEDTFHHQHHAHFVEPTTLVMLDNFHGRGLQLSVDVARRTAVVERSFATGSPQCGPQGTATTTSTGHFLVGCSTDGRLADDDPEGQLVWSAHAECETALFATAARYTPLDGW